MVVGEFLDAGDAAVASKVVNREIRVVHLPSAIRANLWYDMPGKLPNVSLISAALATSVNTAGGVAAKAETQRVRRLRHYRMP